MPVGNVKKYTIVDNRALKDRCVDNHVLRDENLSSAAKELFGTLCSLPEGFYLTEELAAAGCNDAELVDALLKELKKAGYISLA